MQNSESGGEHRAAAAQSPEPTRGLKREREEFQQYRWEREGNERRSVVRGLILLAVLALLGSILHAGLARVFVHGWWRSCADGGSLMYGPARMVEAVNSSSSLG